MVVSKDGCQAQRFLAVDVYQMSLVEPETKRLGWGVVKFAGLLQVSRMNRRRGDGPSNLMLKPPSPRCLNRTCRCQVWRMTAGPWTSSSTSQAPTHTPSLCPSCRPTSSLPTTSAASLQSRGWQRDASRRGTWRCRESQVGKITWFSLSSACLHCLARCHNHLFSVKHINVLFDSSLCLIQVKIY